MSSLIPISETIISNNTGLDAITRAPIVDYETKVRCLRIQNVSHDEPFEMWGYTEVSEQNYKNFQLQKDDIIISRTGGSIGTLMYIDKDYKSVYNNGLICLKIDKERYNPRYIYYCLKLDGFKKHIQKCSLGNSTQENIRMNDMLEYMIPDFNLKIQNQIVDVLKDLDDKIQNNNAINVELESMAKTIYDYWFLQFEFPNEEGKPYKSSGGKMVWNEELKREIPEGWGVKVIEDFCRIFTGKKDVNQALEAGEYKFFSCSPDYKYSNEMLHSGKAILVSGNGSYTGRTIFVNDAFDLYQRTYACVSSTDKDILEYIYYSMLRVFTQKVGGGTHGSAIPYIVFDDIAKEPILYNADIVEKYQNIVIPLQEKIIKNQRENEELSSLRDFLLPMLMNGQVEFK